MTDKLSELEARIARLESTNPAIVDERRIAKQLSDRLTYRSWLADGHDVALTRLLQLSHYDQVQCLKAWSRDEQIQVLAVADDDVRGELIDRAQLGPTFAVECALTAEPHRCPSYAKVHPGSADGWSRSTTVVSRKAGKALKLAGFEVDYLDVAGKDPHYQPTGWSKGQWRLLTTAQLDTLLAHDRDFVRAVEDQGLRIEVLTPAECRTIAITRGEILPAGKPAPAVEILEEPDRWAVMASRHKVAK